MLALDVSNRREFFSGAAISLAAGLASVARATTLPSASSLPAEGHLPSLKHATGWLNSAQLDHTDLRGKVVAINFCTYTCINWLRTAPYVRAWSKKYRGQGLVVIGVHTPEFSFEHNIDHVRLAMHDRQIDYPIAIDNDYAIWQAFSNEYWPALYFIDARGRIRNHKFGEGAYDTSEAVIRNLLTEAGTTPVDRDSLTTDPHPIEIAADWADLRSPENYVGKARTQNFANSHTDRSYSIPSRLKLNQWALSGDWTLGKEAIVLNEPQGRIAYRFHARDLHLVMSPGVAGHALRYRVLLDGLPPGPAAGSDIDENGYGTLAAPRLYQLIRQPKPITDRLFTIEFLDRGAQAFAFTFG